MGHPTDPLVRVGTSGTEARGKHYSNTPATAGLVFTSVGPEDVPAWAAPPVSALPLLTATRIVDVGTSVPLANQTGTFGAPYSTITRALVDLVPNAGQILCVPGDYTAEGPIAIGNAGGGITITNLAMLWNYAVTGNPDGPVVLPALTALGALQVQGCACTSTVQVPSLLFGQHSGFDGLVQAQGISAEFCTFDNTGRIETTSDTTLTHCWFNRVGTLFTTANELVIPQFLDCTFIGGAMVFTGALGEVNFDQKSFDNFLTHGGVLTNCRYVPLPGVPITGIFIDGAKNLAAGINLLASVATPLGLWPSDIGVFVGCCGAPQPAGVMFAGSYRIDTQVIELYAINYTGAALPGYPGATLRWRVIAP